MMRLEATEAIRSFNKLLAEFSSQHEQALATMQQSAAQRSRQSRGMLCVVESEARWLTFA